MTREELIQLRDAIDMTLALPDSVRELLAQWLAPAAVKQNGNGVDHHPPEPVSKPRPAKAKPPQNKSAHAAELKLLDAMRDSSV
jgi:hypothetical protein